MLAFAGKRPSPAKYFINNVLMRVAIAAGLLVAATAARSLLDPALGGHLPYVTYFIAIALIAWLTTTRIAIVSLAIGWLIADFLFVPPRAAFIFLNSDPSFIVGTAAYFAVASTSIAIAHLMRLAQHREVEHRERLRTTLASIGDAVLTTDGSGNITSMNAVAETLTGWITDEAIGKPLETVFRIVNEKTRSPVANPAAKALSEGVIVGLANHTVLIAKDGTERPIDDSAAPILGDEGELLGCVLIFRDITARRKAEEAVRESETLKTAMFETALDCIISMDHRGRVVEFNPAAEQTFGYARKDVIGRELAELIIPHELRESHRRGLARYLETGEGPVLNQRIELNAIRSDGSQFLVELTVTRLPSDGPPLFTAYLRDITERKRMEDDLRKYAADLSEADRRKNEFLATLAHELRNPLAPIRNAVELLNLAGSDGTRATAATGMIERQVAQLVRLVDDLLDVSRISRGKIELRREKVDLAPIIHNVVETASDLVQCMNHELTISLPHEPVYLNADPTRMTQIVGNLLNNACKFTNNGGRISLTLERDGETAVVRVRDNGIGIAPDRLPYIFDMFMQVDNSLERSGGGLGIGLTLVKQLVEMHGGFIEAHSAGIGRGSELVVRLPVWKKQDESTREMPKKVTVDALLANHPSHSRRILVVEDNADSAASLEVLLKMKGNQTRIASDGIEAIDAAKAFLPEIILMDIGLPNLNGYEACRKIREQPWGKDIVVVALTGWGQEDDRRKSKDAGFDGHLVKPVEFPALLKLIDELTAKKTE